MEKILSSVTAESVGAGAGVGELAQPANTMAAPKVQKGNGTKSDGFASQISGGSARE